MKTKISVEFHICISVTLSPNKTAFSSKTLMCKSDSTSAKCPPVVSLSKIAPQPVLDASVFNKKLQFGICIGLNESSILFIHHKMFFQYLKFSSFCQIFPWQSRVRNFYAIPMTGYAMGQSARKENCLLIYQVVLQIS